MTLWGLLAIAGFVAANAFFVAAEFGLVAVRRTRVAELAVSGNRRALSAAKAISELNLMLSACQLGITFSSLGLGAIGEPVLARSFERLFAFFSSPFDLVAAHGTAVVAAFTVITFLHVVLGELVPKNLAIAVPEKIALWVATPIRLFTFLFRPFIWFFNEAANVVLRAFRVVPKSEITAAHTPDELAIIVEESTRGGAIEEMQSELLTRTLEFAEKRAVEAMVPRVSAQAIKEDLTAAEVLELVKTTGYSRFPVWRDRPDEFVGAVYVKDVLQAPPAEPVSSLMKQTLLVPESVLLEEVLVQMQRTRHHFAIVLDEFGSTAGILTLEDVLEELVGEIRDEHDPRERDVTEIEGGYRVPGGLRPDELEEATEVRLPEGDYETIAGFILENLGRLARRGDEVQIEGWRFRVANVRRRRIVTVDLLRP